MSGFEEGKTEDFGDSYYQIVSRDDIIENFRPLLMSGGFRLRDEDGKICVTTPSMAWDTPWHHIAHDSFLDCQRWHSIMFDLFSRLLPADESFVPSACHQCWKVVVRPNNLLGLFALMHLQIKLDRPSKCGIEIRPYVHGLYGGYFYNHSLREGLDCYKLVREEADKTRHLGPETKIILKRACTEYEKKCGDSSKWKVSEKQMYIETLINKWFVRDDIVRDQPQHLISRVHRKWIEWAYANGDPTYIEFTGGKPLFKPVVTYHHLLNNNDPDVQDLIKSLERKYYYGYDL